MEGWRDGGMEGRREGRREGWMDGWKKGWRDGKVAERLDSIFKKTTAKILGWSEQEAAEAQLQAELHPEDGGHGACSTAELAPLLHLASWLSCSHEHASDSAEPFAVIPASRFFAGSDDFSQKMESLYLEVRQINETLPDSFEQFVKRTLATNSFEKRVNGQKRTDKSEFCGKGRWHLG